MDLLITNVVNDSGPDLGLPGLTSQLRLMAPLFGAPVSPLQNGEITVFFMK